MRALIWIAAILALLILFLILLRLRLTGVYGEGGASLTVSLGAVPVFRLPRPPGSGTPPGKSRRRRRRSR